MSSGLDGYIAIARETTSGTYETPGRALEFLSESLALNVDRIPSAAIRGGRRTNHKWKVGARRVEGSIDMEVGPQGLGLLLESCLGGDALSEAPATGGNSNPTKNRHLLTPGSIAGKTLSTQVGRPMIDGTVVPFSYNGLAVTDWNMSISSQELLQLSVSLYGLNESTTLPAVTPNYNDYDPFTFIDGALVITPEGEAPVNVCVTDWNVSGSNNLATERFFICADDTVGLSRAALDSSLREYSGTFTGEFENLDWYNWYVNGEEAKMVMTFQNAAGDILRISQNVRFDGETPNVGGPEILEISLPYVSTSELSDADVMTIELFNDDASI